MLRKLTVLLCLISFSPVAAGAEELALLVSSQPTVAQPAAKEPSPGINLSLPDQQQAPALMAANDLQGTQVADPPRARKTHSGLSFREFIEVHFGEYRWVYWIGATAALVVLHVFAFGND